MSEQVWVIAFLGSAGAVEATAAVETAGGGLKAESKE